MDFKEKEMNLELKEQDSEHNKKRRGKVFANKCPQSACINGEVRIPIIPLVSLGYMPQVIKSQFMTLSIVRRVYRMKKK